MMSDTRPGPGPSYLMIQNRSDSEAIFLCIPSALRRVFMHVLQEARGHAPPRAAGGPAALQPVSVRSPPTPLSTVVPRCSATVHRARGAVRVQIVPQHGFALGGGVGGDRHAYGGRAAGPAAARGVYGHEPPDGDAWHLLRVSHPSILRRRRPMVRDRATSADRGASAGAGRSFATSHRGCSVRLWPPLAGKGRNRRRRRRRRRRSRR